MKKNNIFIVVDSLFYDKTIKTNNHPQTMPFLDKLRKEGLNFTNMYSEAPYTEAALVSLLCGMDTLKHGGYMKKLFNKKTLFQVFDENGYDTFSNCVQPQVYPTYAYPGLKYQYYNVCYDFEVLWSYRLKYYSELFKDNLLDEESMNLIIELLNDNLITWLNFFDSLKNNGEITKFIYKYVDRTDLDKNINLLKKEISNFEKDKLSYTKELLKLGYDHPLFKIKSYNLSKKNSLETMQQIENKYKKVIYKLQRKNVFYNLKNNKFKIDKNFPDSLKAYMNSIYNRFLYSKIDAKIASKKAAPSMNTTIEYFCNWVLNRDKTNPYFAYIHVDDCHREEIFYTYDTSDFNLLDEEFKLIDNYINNLPKNYKGSISYDVSLQYADLCIKRLFKFLEKNNMLDDVNVFICADHGSSYSFAPYRSNYVNNEHRENYNMPFVIWSKDFKHKQYNEFYNTKDIPATIIDFNNIKIPKEYDGFSVLKNKRDYVLLENVPGGCPDYNKRNFWLGIRNKKYLIVMELNAFKTFKEGSVIAVYDLINDACEYNNLKNNIDNINIKKELAILEKEFDVLKKDMMENNFIEVKK